MTESQAVTLAKEFRDAYNDFELDQPHALELFTDDVFYYEVRSAAFQGKEALKEYLIQLAREIQTLNLSWEFTNVITQSDQVAVEWIVRSGIEFAGKRLELPGVSFFKVRDGKICYYSEYFDTAILEKLAE